MTLPPDIAKKLRADLSESSGEFMWADKEVIRRLSRAVKADWNFDHLLGFMVVMSSIWSQAKERDSMIMYNSLNMNSLRALVMGIGMRDMEDEEEKCL